MSKGTKVLIIDDDKTLSNMYKERLGMSGYEVIVSHNGETGLSRIHQEKPDIILLDLMIPKLDGYSVLATIKSDPEIKNIPVIILSALTRNTDKNEAAEVGADGYLVKSESMPYQVIKKIETVLAKKNI